MVYPMVPPMAAQTVSLGSCRRTPQRVEQRVAQAESRFSRQCRCQPITRLFDDRTAAIEAVRKLEAAGLQSSEISMMSSNADNWYSGDRSTSVDRDRDGVDDRAEAAGTDAGVGTAIGGAAGLLAGLGILAIPGLAGR